MCIRDSAWAGFGAAFGPVIVLSLYWKRFTYKGAVAGIICGGATAVSYTHLDVYKRQPYASASGSFLLYVPLSIFLSFRVLTSDPNPVQAYGQVSFVKIAPL